MNVRTLALAGAMGGTIILPGSTPDPASWSYLWKQLATVLTDAGRAILTDRLKGAGGAEPNQVGWGTGAGTAAVGDTTLFNERADDLTATTGSRTAGTSTRVTTSVANDTYEVVATKTATGAGSVTNAGLWNNAAIGSGNLFMKGDFASIGLAINDSITFTFRLQFT